MPPRIALFLFLTACVGWAWQRPAPNSNCEWPAHSPDERLTRDAEFAEDLAIRYADRCCGPHSGHFVDMEAYGQMRDACMASLFQNVAREHGVTVDRVRQSLQERPKLFDLSVLFSFAGLLMAAAYLIRRLAVQWDWPPVMTVYVSAVLAAAGVLLLDVWSGAMEDLRIGNGHLSYRGERIPWLHHRLFLFAGFALLSWAVTMLGRRWSSRDAS